MLQSIEVNGLQFVAHHTPGHAQHHIAWQLGNVIFTGDVAGVSIHHGPVIPPCPPPDINRELWLDSIDLLLELEDIDEYYLTHFGCITDIIPHMNKLKLSIQDYTAFMQPFALAGKTLEDTLPEFRTFVKNYLVDHGLEPRDAEAYEAANPSDMSATGLMRYWKKRMEA